VDYATHGFPPATEKAFIEQGIRIIRPPIYSGPAVFFNHDIYPFNRVEVRQAVAYAINKDDNAVVSLGQSAKAPRYQAGFSDNLVPLWIPEADLAQFEEYKFDAAKAEALLTGIGFKKDSDGVWMDDQGKRMEYEMIFPAEYADWAAAAENAAQQLTAFGIKTAIRGVTFTQQPIEVNRGNFQLAIQGWGAGNPHPHFSFVTDLFTRNYVQAAEGKGMNFPLKQTVEGLGELDLEELVVASADGLDETAQKEKIAKVAMAFNKLLPIVPLWERYGNNASMDGVRATGWPAEGDAIYKNSPYSDSFVVIMILTGRLQPVAR
jgi:peptide/nickel transport system substrate-binding protein